MPRCIIFANGTLPDPDSARRVIHPNDFIIAADGGTRHARTLGLLPAVIVGDLDSLSPSDRVAVDAAGTNIIQYPRDKNETDLELAIHFAIESGYREIIIMAALGGRLDQTLGNLSLLSDPRYLIIRRGMGQVTTLRLDDGVEQAFFCRDHAEVEGRSGDTVSLIPWNGEVTGVRTEGLRWPLSNETLFPHKTRGVSNELLGEHAHVQIATGLLLIIHRRQPTKN